MEKRVTVVFITASTGETLQRSPGSEIIPWGSAQVAAHVRGHHRRVDRIHANLKANFQNYFALLVLLHFISNRIKKC